MFLSYTKTKRELQLPKLQSNPTVDPSFVGANLEPVVLKRFDRVQLFIPSDVARNGLAKIRQFAVRSPFGGTHHDNRYRQIRSANHPKFTCNTQTGG